jgi:hypothetical protein
VLRPQVVDLFAVLKFHGRATVGARRRGAPCARGRDRLLVGHNPIVSSLVRSRSVAPRFRDAKQRARVLVRDP